MCKAETTTPSSRQSQDCLYPGWLARFAVLFAKRAYDKSLLVYFLFFLVRGLRSPSGTCSSLSHIAIPKNVHDERLQPLLAQNPDAPVLVHSIDCDSRSRKEAC